MSKKIYVTGKATLATLDDSDKVLVMLGAANPDFDIRENTLHEIEFSDLKTQLEAGIFNFPTFADNDAALAGLLVAGQIYKTATGELRIVV